MTGWPLRDWERENPGSTRSGSGTATARELAVIAAVMDAGSGKAAAHRLGLSNSTVKHHLANRAVEGRGDDDGAARVDPRVAAAVARWRSGLESRD